jgi:hypothetical protein
VNGGRSPPLLVAAPRRRVLHCATALMPAVAADGAPHWPPPMTRCREAQHPSRAKLHLAHRCRVRPRRRATCTALQTTRQASSAAGPASSYFVLRYDYVSDILEKRGPYREAHLRGAQDKVGRGVGEEGHCGRWSGLLVGPQVL